MAGRLKRRSSIGLAARRDSLGPAEPDLATPAMEPLTDDAQEAAERRARNLQRRQNQMETEVTESPGMERQGSSTSRRSVGGISGLSHAQLAEHYQHCLKLSAENKVSQKNAFNLQLIDWMAQAIGKKAKKTDGEVDINDFQIAAGTLDASTKIYGFRVDVVYNDTFKLASGLTQSGKQKADEPAEGEQGGEGEEGATQGEGKKKRRIKKSATVEKNLKNINIGKMELEFDVDPLFKKTTSQFDAAGGGGNQFLASLRLRDDSAAMLMDSESTLETRDLGDVTPHKASTVHARIPALAADFHNLQVSTDELREFNFLHWNLEEEDRLNKSISASQEGRQEEEEGRMEENAFDAFAVPEPVEDWQPEGMVDNDMEEEPEELGEVSERALGHAGRSAGPGFTANLQMTTEDMLQVLTTAPLEYSYFDHGKLGAWAGPKHWKFKALTRAREEGEEGATKGGRKKKQLENIDYEDFEGFSDADLAKLSALLQPPKKSVKLIDKTMKGWNRERSTMPEDLHYSGHELVRLKHVEKIMVTASSSAREEEVQVDEDVEDYDYDNAGDNEGYCPGLEEGQEDAYGDGEAAEAGEVGETEARAADYGGDNLVEAPKLVDKASLQIGYAKTAKKVDMKRIKEASWRILTQASSEDKENQEVQEQEDTDLLDTNFTSLYKSLKQPGKLPKTMSENLSVPLAFIALLHLCNENTLALESTGDQFADFKITKG